jgi:hypothetical protein
MTTYNERQRKLLELNPRENQLLRRYRHRRNSPPVLDFVPFADPCLSDRNSCGNMRSWFSLGLNLDEFAETPVMAKDRTD